MSAVAVLVVTDTDGTIGFLNGQLAQIGQTNDKHAMISFLENYLSLVKSSRNATFQLTTRDTAPTITTSGTGSTQYTFGT